MAFPRQSFFTRLTELIRKNSKRKKRFARKSRFVLSAHRALTCAKARARSWKPGVNSHGPTPSCIGSGSRQRTRRICFVRNREPLLCTNGWVMKNFPHFTEVATFLSFHPLRKV